MIAIIFTACCIIVITIATLLKHLEQKRCKHVSYREDQACDAWCKSCGKNLGFIGSLRKNKLIEEAEL